MNKKQQLNLIHRAWRNIDECLATQHFGMYGKEYLKLNKEEEKSHDRMRSYEIKRGISINEAAKVFYVQQIIEGLMGQLKFEVKDYLSIRKSCFFAMALVENYRAELEEALKDFNYAEILAIDYCELIK